MKKSPYLSIVIAARNDNYGGDFNQRIQNFISWNTDLLEKNKIETEIIIVNWNPIEENPSLFEALQWLKERQFVKFRIITIPHTIHQKFVDSTIRKTVPLFEYLTKNAGIRRAKGEYILAMNPDILIHPNTMLSIKHKLNNKTYFRANRIDFKKCELSLNTIKKNGFKLYMKGYSYKKHPLFLLSLFNNFRIYFQLVIIRKFESLFKIIDWRPNNHNAEYKYHCNVSGDFLLMHKDNWFALNAHPENTKLALHTDALMVVMAGTSGLKEKVLKNPIFHQEHTRRFNAEEKDNTAYRDAYLHFQNEAQVMIKEQKPTIYNDDSWGLINFELPEIEF
tara:strand:+ start:950 stop:1954 length:1005 start_codon:yes stop_codon:yes gene_type:complete